MGVKKWSKKQRAKFMATLAKRKRTGGWGRGRTRKPYRKPQIKPKPQIARVKAAAGSNELLIRIELV